MCIFEVNGGNETQRALTSQFAVSRYSWKNLANEEDLVQNFNMRIVQVGYWQHRRFGKAHVSTEHKLYFGLIRSGHTVWHFSDRDMAAFHSPFGLRDLGVGKANRRLIETCDNYKPDLLLVGHCDLISNRTLEEIRKLLPSIRIAYRNVDPLFVPHNVTAIHARKGTVDTIFITTAGPLLDQFRDGRATVHHMPNPTDISVETLDNSKVRDLPIDLLFCGNSNEHSNRMERINYLRDELAGGPVAFRTPGIFGLPTVWGIDYDAMLAQTRMGLNLNRQEGHYLYTSARLAQLMGNGILPFIDRASKLQNLMGEDGASFFTTKEELLANIRAFKADDARRQSVAAEGRRFYREHFSSENIAQYILERTLGIPFSRDYIWSKE